MDEQSPYFEATYQQLRETNRAAFNKLQNSVLRSFVMKQLDPADDTSIFQVFERLNSGGVVLPVSYTHLDVYKRQCSC